MEMETENLVDGRPSILLIGDTNEFLLNALERDLKGKDFSVKRCVPNVNRVGEANTNAIVYI